MEKDKLKNSKVVLIGGSAGSLDVLMKMLPKLQLPMAFALVIILHRKGNDDSLLEELIAVKTTVPVTEVEDKTPLLPGFIYIAPADYHLLFEKNNLLSLDASEKINFSRPSIDVAFESAAAIFGTQLAAILLSGANTDGTLGLQAIRKAGGIAIVQDPETAEMAYMPANAIQQFTPDFIVRPEEIAGLLNGIGI